MDEDIKNLRAIASFLGVLNPGGRETDQLRTLADKLEGKVLIDPEELEELEKDSDTLAKLESAGVDNWEGYHLALFE
jgi:hypothetical protein